MSKHKGPGRDKRVWTWRPALCHTDTACEHCKKHYTSCAALPLLSQASGPKGRFSLATASLPAAFRVESGLRLFPARV